MSRPASTTSRSTRQVRPFTTIGTSVRTKLPVAAARRNATWYSNRDRPLAAHRAHPAPATREAGVVTHSWPRRHRHRHRSLARAASCAGSRPGTVRFSTNWAATSGATCSRDRPLFGRRLLAAHLCGAQCGHPLPFMTRLTTVASQDPPQDPHRHRHRSNELGRHRDNAHPGLVMFSTNSATTCGATLAAVAPSALGRRRAAALARFLHNGQPLPDARLATLALHTCAQLGQRHSQRWLDPGRRSGGAMSGRSRLRTNCAASSGLRSASDAPAGACAWVRARTCLAHSGHPPLALRAAGGASHS